MSIIIFSSFSHFLPEYWKYYAGTLAGSKIALVPVLDELIDKFWSAGLGRPPQPDTPINALPMVFAGNVFKPSSSHRNTHRCHHHHRRHRYYRCLRCYHDYRRII